MIRRFGAIGDIHAEDERLAIALAHLRASNVDAILAVGDIVDGKGDVDRCCALLREANALVVRGNHDRWFVQNKMLGLPDATPRDQVSKETRAFLAALPATRRRETVRGPLLLCHAVGEDDMSFLRSDTEGYALEVIDALQAILRSDVRLMVGGHTHERMVRAIGALTIVNAGTLYRENEPGCVRVDLERGLVEYFDVPLDGEVTSAERFTLR